MDMLGYVGICWSICDKAESSRRIVDMFEDNSRGCNTFEVSTGTAFKVLAALNLSEP